MGIKAKYMEMIESEAKELNTCIPMMMLWDNIAGIKNIQVRYCYSYEELEQAKALLEALGTSIRESVDGPKRDEKSYLITTIKSRVQDTLYIIINYGCMATADETVANAGNILSDIRNRLVDSIGAFSLAFNSIDKEYEVSVKVSTGQGNFIDTTITYTRGQTKLMDDARDAIDVAGAVDMAHNPTEVVCFTHHASYNTGRTRINVLTDEEELIVKRVR